MSDFDVTVQLGTRNRSAFLCQTLEAMCEVDRDGLKVQFVVVDNNSTDDTAAVIESFTDRLPLCHLFEARPGQNSARNHAIDTVELGDIVVFTDDDVVPCKDWLKQIVHACRQWPECDIGGGKIELIWPENVHIPRWAREVVSVRETGFAEHDLGAETIPYRPGSTPSGPNYWIRASIFEGGARFDESIGPRPGRKWGMGSEAEFLLRLAAAGKRALYVPDAVVGHHVQTSLLVPRNMRQRAMRHGRGLPRRSGIPDPEKLKQHPWRWRARRLLAMAWYLTQFVWGQLHWDACVRMENAVKSLRKYAYHSESLAIGWRAS